MTTTERPALTNRQRAILAYIVTFWGVHGYPPSMRDICDEFEFASPNGAAIHLRILAAKGYVTRVTKKRGSPARARSVVVPELLEAARTAADAYLAALEG